MVSAYTDEVYFPENRWKNFWTGNIHEAGTNSKLTPSAEHGGGLFIREGGIVPLIPAMQYRNEREIDQVELHIFPGKEESCFEFYEDDGISYGYRLGKFSLTAIYCRKENDSIIVRLEQTAKDFPLPENRTWSLVVALEDKPATAPAEWIWDSGRHELRIPSCTIPLELKIELS